MSWPLAVRVKPLAAETYVPQTGSFFNSVEAAVGCCWGGGC